MPAGRTAACSPRCRAKLSRRRQAQTIERRVRLRTARALLAENLAAAEGMEDRMAHHVALADLDDLLAK
ncbi:MAG TPA: hypothetical protein VML54_05935 [Candidatus Limnocylindrales bacterium]|nr:hypothetical protein [Candidatus Limnocylindrales bacterium]